MFGMFETSKRARITFGILRRMKSATMVIMILAIEISLLVLVEMILLEPRKIL